MISKTIKEDTSGGIQIYNIEILRKGNIKPTLSTAGFGFKEQHEDEDAISNSSERKKEKTERLGRIQKKKPTINVVQEESAR